MRLRRGLHRTLCSQAVTGSLSRPVGGLGRRNGAMMQASDADTVLRDTRSMEQLRTAADWQLERAYAKVRSSADGSDASQTCGAFSFSSVSISAPPSSTQHGQSDTFECRVLIFAHQHPLCSQLREVANTERERMARLEAERPSPADQRPSQQQQQQQGPPGASASSPDSSVHSSSAAGSPTDAAQTQPAGDAAAALPSVVRLSPR